MPRTLLKRLTAPLICMGVAIAGGLVGGETATQGLQLQSYGMSAASAASPKRSNSSDLSVYDQTDCNDCSERDRGFHWATARGISSPLDCPQESWNFQRGCLDYLRSAS